MKMVLTRLVHNYLLYYFGYLTKLGTCQLTNQRQLTCEKFLEDVERQGNFHIRIIACQCFTKSKRCQPDLAILVYCIILVIYSIMEIDRMMYAIGNLILICCDEFQIYDSA